MAFATSTHLTVECNSFTLLYVCHMCQNSNTNLQPGRLCAKLVLHIFITDAMQQRRSHGILVIVLLHQWWVAIVCSQSHNRTGPTCGDIMTLCYAIVATDCSGSSVDTRMENRFLGKCNSSSVKTCGHTSTVACHFAHFYTTSCDDPIESATLLEVCEVPRFLSSSSPPSSFTSLSAHCRWAALTSA